MKKILIAFFFFTVGVLFSQTRVSTLSQLRSAIQNSNQEIIMQAGNYNLEDLSSSVRDLDFSGSNNTVDLRGVYIEVPVGSVDEEYIHVPGNNNTIIGGEIEDVYRNGMTEVTDFSAYNQDRNNLAHGLGGDAVMRVLGNNNVINGIKITTRGSYPYGYGSMYGIGSDNVYGLDKRCGLLINGNNTIIENIEIQQRAFGHGFFVQGDADNTIIRNSIIEGRVRRTAELYNETNTFDLPYRSNYQQPLSDNNSPIPTDEVHSLCEDGIRMYNIPGSITVENCRVSKMRGGIRLYLGGPAKVTDSYAVDCGDTNYNMPSGGTIENSSGNFAYAPLYDNRLGRGSTTIEWTVLPSPNAEGPHNIADITGNNQNIIFHRTPGPIDSDEKRAIVITSDNCTIVNETEYTIILESSANGNDITSCGPVIDNGSGNDVNSSNNCDFDTTATPTPTTPVTGASFTPDPNRTYYIDVPEHNLRLAATGESEDAYTTSTSTTGANVEWQFVDKGNGSWHVQLAADVSKPRLRTRNNGGETDMQATSSDGTWTYWDFTTGSSSNTYFFTLPDGPGDQTRLQVDREGDINMVTPSHDGTWESFRITPAGFVTNGTVVQITKRNATGFAFDGGNGGENEQDLYLWGANQNNVNQQWIEIDRGNGYYSYQKLGTDYCIDGNGGGETGQNVYLWACSDNNQNQHWKKVSTAGGSFRLEKRNSPAYSLDGNRGGENGQSVYLWNSDSNNQNQQWFITPIGASAKSVADIVPTNDVIVFPNPVVNTATIQGAANTTISIYDISGQQLLVKEITTDSEEINLSALPTGIYYGQLVGAQSIFAIKIVKK